MRLIITIAIFDPLKFRRKWRTKYIEYSSREQFQQWWHQVLLQIVCNNLLSEEWLWIEIQNGSFDVRVCMEPVEVVVQQQVIVHRVHVGYDAAVVSLAVFVEYGVLIPRTLREDTLRLAIRCTVANFIPH